MRQLKYQIILQLENNYSVSLLCAIAEVSRSSYYRFKRLGYPKKATNIDAEHLEALILYLHHKSNQRAGYRMITDTLKNEKNIIVNHKKVYRIMKENNIHSVVRKKFRVPSEIVGVKENLLNRDFVATKPGEKFVTDITYIPTRQKMMYLSMVIDLFDNHPVAWKISDCQDETLSIDPIKELAAKCDLTNAIIHSDQGIHYRTKNYIELLEGLSVNQSMSRKGNCWDNAAMESFFSHYKCECIYLMKNKIRTAQDVIELTEEYIDYYTNERPQRRLGGVPPSRYRQTYKAS